MHPRPRRSARTSKSRPRSMAAGREAKPWWSTAVRRSLSSSSGRSREASNVSRTVSAAPGPAVGDEHETSPASRLLCHASDHSAPDQLSVSDASLGSRQRTPFARKAHSPRSQRDARVGRSSVAGCADGRAPATGYGSGRVPIFSRCVRKSSRAATRSTIVPTSHAGKAGAAALRLAKLREVGDRGQTPTMPSARYWSAR